jgi:DNA-binding transcriptional regulator YhcF (GntR family)
MGHSTFDNLESRMNIRINTESDVPIRYQLAEQIVFLIVTDRLKAGQQLPSVRELARRLKIHHNTVSESYQDLVRRNWLQRRRGSRLVVNARESLTHPRQAQSLDDLINTTIRTARLMGYSMQSLRDRVRERLLSHPPDHILVIEQDPGLRELMREELRASLKWPVEACSREDLEANPGLAIGALAVTPQHAVNDVAVLFPKDRPVVAISFSSADEHLERIRNLAQPSTIAVVSASRVFLTVARGILAPVVGQRHSLEEVLLPDDTPGAAAAADIVFCDSIAKRLLRQPRAIHYRLITADSLKYVSTTVKSYMS